MPSELSSGKPRSIVALGVGLALALFSATFRGPRTQFWQRMTLTGLTLGSFSLLAKPSLRRIQFGRRELLLGLGSAGILHLLFSLGDRFARWLLPSGGQQIEQIYALNQLRPKPEIMARLALVIAPAEELFWRGLVQRELMRRYGPRWGTLLGVVSYGSVHLASGNLTLIAAATTAGAFWGALYALGVPLGALIVSHVAWDNLIFLISPTSRRHQEEDLDPTA